MKIINPLAKGFNVSITLKNNKAQVILAIGIFILCIGITFSFYKGNSTITVNHMSAPINEEMSDEAFSSPFLNDSFNTNNVKIIK